MLALVSAQTCERCGAPLPLDARFCPRCGAPIALATTEERKVVSILFADVADSTELAATLDPERFREVIGAFYSTVSEELESMRGRAEKFAGDAVMAVFGIPQTHDDDAVRAVRAGLMIRDRTGRLGEELGLAMPLRVRVGVNSGAVATGSGPADQFLVSGAPVNLAARLQENAEPNEVLAGETTRQLTQNAVEFAEPRGIAAKGFVDAIRAWPVVGLSTRSTRRTIPLVDRRHELSLLVDAFERVGDSRRAHLVTILGEPGIGKSRLVEELVAGLPEEARVLTGRATEFGEDVTFAPIAEMIRRELGVSAGVPARELRARLEELVRTCCGPSETKLVVARLGLALGLGREPRDVPPEQFWSESLKRFEAFVEGDAGGESGRYRIAEVRAGLMDLLEGMTRTGPVVMVFEDLHRAQPELLDLVEQMMRRSRRLPLLALCVARDELLEKREGWGGGVADAVTLRLDPLSDRDAKDLAQAAGEVDDGTAVRIARHAGGNPFFIIETTGMLLQEHAEHLLGTQHSHILPPTVQAVVAARMDRLPDPARDLVRKASVFPRSTFHTDELALVAEPKEEILELLEDEEVLARDRERPNVWRFRHDVLRDVAYQSLPKRERMRLHLLVAEGFESSDPDRYPQSVAYHLEQAARASIDLDPSDRSIADRAVKALTKAGDVTRRRMESRTSLDLYERALALAGPSDGWGAREAWILSAMGEVRYWLGEYDTARVSLTKALRLAPDDLWVRAHASRFLGDITLNIQGDYERAKEAFDDALAASKELDDPWVLARAYLMAGWAPYWVGDLNGAREMFEHALETARSGPEEDRWAEARALVALTSVISPVGDEQDCLGLANQALELGQKMGDQFTMAVAQETVGNSLRRMMRLEESLPFLDEAVTIFRELGSRWELASALGDRGEVHFLAERLPEAEADLSAALDLCRQLGERSLVTWTSCELVKILLAKGDLPAARALYEGSSELSATKEPGTRGGVLVAECWLALAEGDRDRARELALEVLELDRAEGWRNVVAARTWWVGSLFGADTVGGEGALEEAERILKEANWAQYLREPDLVLQAVGS
jgi:class 3 adenylate cyclase/tetratricopeptide (TPR) repeat protein